MPAPTRPAPVVVAPDAFKGSIGARAAADALAEGWLSVRPGAAIERMPMADGGEGTLDAFAAAIPQAQRMPVRVTGPEDAPVDATWLLLPPTADAPDGTAVVELASTSGIELLGSPPRLRPLAAHTRGFGEAIQAALAHGVSRLVCALGGSSSTDGGVGLLSALGARFTDSSGAPVPAGGRGLAVIAEADLSSLPPLPVGGVTVLADVSAPLLGTGGAAHVFAPQKGASPLQVAALDAGLAVLAQRLGIDPGRRGAGAAGGAAYGLLAWGARLVPGADAVADLIGLDEVVRAASIVVAGEGAFDGSSAGGKAAAHVHERAASAGVPAALVAGRIAADAPTEGFVATLSLTHLAGSADAAMADPARWLREAGAILARTLPS
ncbi:glycerate kinase [Microbacterium sp. LRZ72]|uniref:glycerate kinase n=1 Tax=Microbacterium sp. LRZ72 TaxID=2942481 RepID=UPI0029B0D1DD|nr:glycerate kinase [Microbacterium sp. LRZ72]MDX2376489.1 glycerate kinase [Microbacterium sp. LRZ72]